MLGTGVSHKVMFRTSPPQSYLLLPQMTSQMTSLSRGPVITIGCGPLVVSFTFTLSLTSQGPQASEVRRCLWVVAGMGARRLGEQALGPWGR